MNWCITPADVSALKQAIGPIVFGCAASGVLVAFAVIVALTWWSNEALKKKEGLTPSNRAMVPWTELMHSRLDAEGFEEEVASCRERIEWMAETSAMFDATDEGEWFVSFDVCGERHSGPLSDDAHHALTLAMEAMEFIVEDKEGGQQEVRYGD